MTKRYTWIVATDPVPGKEAEFDTWYDRHVKDIMAFPGVLSGRRFKTLTVSHLGEPQRRHIALYEIETDDPDALLDQMMKKAYTAEMPTSDAVQPTGISYFCEPI